MSDAHQWTQDTRPAPAARAIQGWAYRTVTGIEGYGHHRAHDPTEMGEQGWELVAVIDPRQGSPSSRTGDVVREFYYKRPLPLPEVTG